jgi:uncharacterized protein
MANWENKSVLITGGSDGLGLAIALAFSQRGAVVTIVGRDSRRLSAAKDLIAGTGKTVHTLSADVTLQPDVQRIFEFVSTQIGSLDVLVNAVGKSVRADFQSVSLQQYREFMDVNFFSAVQCTERALPMLEKTSGHVVNIGSLSSKTAWPFMAPYTASKFALAGYTQQLRLEGPANVHALLVCPGPIKRDEDQSRYRTDSSNLPEKAYQPAAGAKLKGLDPSRVAQAIIKACEQRKPEIILPFKPRILFFLSSISARLGDWIVRKMN